MNSNNFKILKLFCILLIITMMFSLTSCWDNKELDSVSIVLGVGMDIKPESDNTDIDFIFQVNKSFPANSQSGGAPADDKQYYNLETTAIGLPTAEKNINGQLPRSLYMEQNQMVIVGREKAEKGINNCLDAFMRENYMRIEVHLLMADTTAKEILNAKLEQENITAMGLSKLIEEKGKLNKSYESKLYEFVANQNCNSETTPVVPIIKLDKNGENDIFKIKGLAIFDNYKLAGELDEKQTEMYSLIMNYSKYPNYEYEKDDVYINLEIASLKYDMKVDFENDKPFVQISYNLLSSIGEVQGDVNLNTGDKENEMEQLIAEQFTNQLNECADYCKSIGKDVFGFGHEFHRYHPKKWRTMKNNWDEDFKNLDISFDVTMDIFSMGKINDHIDSSREDNQC